MLKFKEVIGKNFYCGILGTSDFQPPIKIIGAFRRNGTLVLRLVDGSEYNYMPQVDQISAN